jgi:hypothetical protein
LREAGRNWKAVRMDAMIRYGDGIKTNPEAMIIDKRVALLDRYSICCSCGKKFPDSTQEYYYVAIIRNGVHLVSEPCCRACLEKFTGLSIGELK